MISLEAARERLLASIKPLASERLPLLEAAGRFAAENVPSRIDLPLFDNSAMDGYAVRAGDLQRASPSAPVHLSLAGRVGAGEMFDGPMKSGECVRIFTGSPLPAGADAVVMQEDVRAGGSSITFTEAAKPCENVRLRGEDIRSGDAILRIGDRINAARASLLAATGTAEAAAGRVPRVGLLATGSELVTPGSALAAGKIYESNRTLLAGLLREIGSSPELLPLAPDDLAGTVAALKSGFERNDVVITTGGVSVGELDFVKDAFGQLGGEIEFWKVAVRPGKPFVFGRLGEKFLFGLPGNPVSALVTFLLLARPALLKMMGARAWELPAVEGELAERISNRGDRPHFVRALLENGKVRAAGPQASHRLGALGAANCLLEVAPTAQLEAGTRVRVQLWQLPEG